MHLKLIPRPYPHTFVLLSQSSQSVHRSVRLLPREGLVVCRLL